MNGHLKGGCGVGFAPYPFCFVVGWDNSVVFVPSSSPILVVLFMDAFVFRSGCLRCRCFGVLGIVPLVAVVVWGFLMFLSVLWEWTSSFSPLRLVS